MKPAPRNIEVMADAVADVYRSKTVAERLRIANRMFELARRMIRGQVQATHPDWTDARMIRETTGRFANGTI